MTKEELKKESEEYAKNNAYKYANDFITCQESYLAGAEPREKRISELEKENAELKRNKKTIVHLANCLEEKMKERLIKAKEIIKKLSYTYKYVIQFEEYADREVLTEAEKFMKEVSELENR